jgi:uncharacterized protein YuzE
MKLNYDTTTDIITIRLTDAKVEQTLQVYPDVTLQLDAEKKIAAIEIHQASQNVAAGSDVF